MLEFTTDDDKVSLYKVVSAQMWGRRIELDSALMHR